MSQRSAIQTYNQIDTQGKILNASPHRMVQILFENAIDRVSKAKAAMLANNVHDKGQYISMAITIIDGLQSSLDHKLGGDVAANLDKLYDYMTRSLLEANLENQVEKLDEVVKLLREIKSGWDQISDAE